VFATGHPYLENYPLHTKIIRMACDRESLGDTDGALFPVQDHTAEEFQSIYNRKVSHIPNAAWMDSADQKEMLRTGEGYFVHRGDTLLGIGRVLGGELRFLAALQRGAGADMIRALAHAASQDRITVEVAAANEKAVKLYEKLGFIPVAELSSWYRLA
jgi:RimJ/RimL family protein N-acetyltransferase